MPSSNPTLAVPTCSSSSSLASCAGRAAARTSTARKKKTAKKVRFCPMLLSSNTNSNLSKLVDADGQLNDDTDLDNTDHDAVLQRLETVKDMTFFLRNALKMRKLNDSSLYYSLVDWLKFNNNNTAANHHQQQQQRLCNWLHALSHIVSLLGASCHALVHSILSLKSVWIHPIQPSSSPSPSDTETAATTNSSSSTNDALFFAFKLLIENIVSAHAFYAAPVLKMLVSTLREPSSSSNTTNPTPTDERVHSLLRRILHLVPTGPSHLVPIITEYFPHKRESIHHHAAYMRNCFAILRYSPTLTGPVVQLAVDRLLAIDVEIQVEMDDLDDLQRAALNEARFGGGGGGGDHEEEEVLVNMYLPNSFTSSNMHSSVDSGTKADGLGGVVRGGEGGGDFSSDSGSDDDDDEDSDDDEDKVDPAKALLHIRLMADKLDAILFVFLSYIQDLVAARQIYYSNDDNNKHHHRHLHHQTPTTILDSHLEFGPLDDLFEILMGVFERTVLPTHRSRFTQYIYFYLCAQSPSYADIFMGHLVSRTFDSSVPTVLRVCAAAYLGSFIARAKYVGIQAVRACLQLLCAWAAEYVDQYDATIAAAATANGGNAVGGGGGSAAVSQRKLADALERLKQQQQAANSDGREASPPRSPPPSSRMDVTPTPPNSPALVNPSTNNSTTAITASTTNIDTKKYASFYTITQAILYIFCFRWRELIGTTGKSDHPCTYDDEEEEEDMDRAPRHLEDVSTDESNSDNTAYTNTTIIKHNNQFRIHSSSTSVAAAAAYPINLSSSSAGQLPSEMRKHFPKIVMSKLTPLRVGCMPSIVAEAARVMHKRELFYCYPFMGNEATTSIGNTDVMEDDESEREKKGTSDVSNADSRTVTSSSTAKSHVVCDFFPFEPLTLIKSGVFANGLYNVYEGGEDNDDQDEEEEGGEEVEEVEELEF